MSSFLAWLSFGGRGKLQESYHDTQPAITAGEREDITSSKENSQEIIRQVLGTHAALLALPNLNPGNIINELLGRLVYLCTKAHDSRTIQEVLSSTALRGVLPSLQNMCSRAEFCLELDWAERTMESRSPDDVYERLTQFPFYANYEQLTRMELCAIASISALPRKVAFIGSGPLPLTSICLLRILKDNQREDVSQSYASRDVLNMLDCTTILNIDHNIDAIAFSSRLCSQLGERGQGMNFICEEAASVTLNLKRFDAVYLAALVGTSQAEKENILTTVAEKMRAGALLVVRCSWGLRTCLYPEVDMNTERLLQRLEPCIVLHPCGQVVNSIIIARVKPTSKQ